MNISG